MNFKKEIQTNSYFDDLEDWESSFYCNECGCDPQGNSPQRKRITLVASIKNRIMNISKKQFTKLAKEHLLALESYKMDKNGNKTIEIFGIEKLYEAINVIQCCKSDSDQLCEHSMSERADIVNSSRTYCLKCSTFL